MKLQTNGELKIILEGSERFLALSGGVVIPWHQIARIAWFDEFSDFRRLWRVAGTGMPGVLLCGHFHGEHAWHFLFVRNPSGWFKARAKNIMLIETRDSTYARIILSVDKEEAAPIIKWWQEGRHLRVHR